MGWSWVFYPSNLTVIRWGEGQRSVSLWSAARALQSGRDSKPSSLRSLRGISEGSNRSELLCDILGALHQAEREPRVLSHLLG